MHGPEEPWHHQGEGKTNEDLEDDKPPPAQDLQVESNWTFQVYKFKFDLQPGSLTDQVAGEHQPSDKHP